MNWYISVLKMYAVFYGRARRLEYWMFMFTNLLVSLVLILIDVLLNSRLFGVGIFSSIYTLAVLIPTLAVTIRRLHDTGRSAWWVFLPLLLLIFSGGLIIVTSTTSPLFPLLAILVLIALVLFIATFIFLLLNSQPGKNSYGPSPKKSIPPAAPLP